ncbi:MAG: type II toxin-antitoxin system prevent-host-death family antitoxin [Deltaproteobacteria bacterium]|nr:type II toxin-antitoxin system prevent-host-death family antitoxin [Deltaproteobacteria bacterium]
MGTQNEMSVYEAKARLSEVLRRVQRKEQVVITSHGRPVARVVPYGEGDEESLESRLAALEEQGLVSKGNGTLRAIAPVAKREGALERFLTERE